MLALPVWAESPSIAIIIDDLGYNWRLNQKAIDLDPRIAVAILPDTPFAKRLANYANQNGNTILLHLPLAAEQSESRADTLPLHEHRRGWQQALQSLPHVKGVNTHMGSAMTRENRLMQELMMVIKTEPTWFFVDSYTTHESVALMAADEAGIPATKRDVFLDAELSESAIAYQFQRLKRLSEKHGVAVAIGHPKKLTLEFLVRHLPTLEVEGFQLITIEDAVQHRRNGKTPHEILSAH